MAIVVEKSRKCLDFGATVYLYHLLFCSLFGGCPSTHPRGTLVVLGEYPWECPLESGTSCSR